jgi:hypothetical protein
MQCNNEVSLCMLDPLVFLDHCVNLTLAVVLSPCSKRSFILLSLSKSKIAVLKYLAQTVTKLQKLKPFDTAAVHGCNHMIFPVD